SNVLARPIPLPAPVTIARFPLSRPMPFLHFPIRHTQGRASRTQDCPMAARAPRQTRSAGPSRRLRLSRPNASRYPGAATQGRRTHPGQRYHLAQGLAVLAIGAVGVDRRRDVLVRAATPVPAMIARVPLANTVARTAGT